MVHDIAKVTFGEGTNLGIVLRARDGAYGGCSAAGSNDAWIRAVLFRVHKESKREAHDHAPDKDQIEDVRVVSVGVTEVPNDGRESSDVNRNLVKP